MTATSGPRMQVADDDGSFYFFLSYAHSGEQTAVDLNPTFSDLRPSPEDASSSHEQLVSDFFNDLSGAVAAQVGEPGRRRIGFYDQQIASGDDLKRRVSEAIGVTEVFVPLLSPRYLRTSWPQKEMGVFRRRVEAARQAPERRIVPVLWTPLSVLDTSTTPTDVTEAMRSLNGTPEEYEEEGVQALMGSFEEAYQQVLTVLSRRIVDVVETSALGPSSAPDLDSVPALGRDEPRFLITLVGLGLGPGDGARPDADHGEPDSEPSLWWRHERSRPESAVAETARSIVERLGFRPQVSVLDQAPGLLGRTPGIVLIDSMTAVACSAKFWRGLFPDGQDWVIPLVLHDSGGTGPEEVPIDPLDLLPGWPDAMSVKPVVVSTMNRLSRVIPGSAVLARRNFLKRLRLRGDRPPPLASETP